MLDKRNHIPLRKRHTIDIVDNSREKIFTISFTQATACETIEFQEYGYLEQLKWLILFIDSNGAYHYPEYAFPKIRWWYPKYIRNKMVKKQQDMVKGKVNKILSDNIENIFKEIIGKYHKEHTSLYDGIQKSLSKGEERRRGVLGSNLMAICKEFNINGINELLDEYTIEQIGWMSDMITFTYYEQTKEGRWANNKMLGGDKLSKDQEAIMKFYDRFDL